MLLLSISFGGGDAPSGNSIAEEAGKRKKEVTMSEKEKKIMETIAKVIKGASAPTKDYLLGWAEGAASVVCGPLLPEQAAAERPGA